MDWYQSVCSGVLLILCISMAAVTNPSSVSLLCLLDPQTPPHPTLPYARSPPSAPPRPATANKYTAKNKYRPNCACAHNPCTHPEPGNLPRLPFFWSNLSRLLCLSTHANPRTHAHTHVHAQRSNANVDKCADGLSLSLGKKKKRMHVC